jgi:ATP-dependent exoDNAse (exonuclease V) beta subunit
MTDQAVREAALRVDQHLLLQAPAGSGKTTVLAQRFLAALAQVDEPEEVLAITFTRKAAAEMRERVLVALEGRLDANQPDRAAWEALRAAVLRQAARRGWLPEELPTRLRIQTIDSLCHEIARAMPLLGRMHQQLDVVDDATAAFLEAAGQCLHAADEDESLRDDADRLLRRLDNDWERAQRLLAELLPSRNRWLPVLLATPPGELGTRVAASLARIVEDTLLALHAIVPEALREEAAQLCRRSAEYRRDSARGEGDWQCWLRPDAALTVTAAQRGAWQAMVALALKDDGDWRALVNVNHGFPPADAPLKQRWKHWLEDLQRVPGIVSRLQAVAALPVPVVDAEESAALAALSRLLLLCAGLLKLEFQRRGQVDHSEVAAVARQALRDMGTPTELSVRQTLRVRHLLVDEFQDTSPDQLDLVRELTQGWEAGDMRSLFLVGDPMQSIYLFRNSEVGLFLRTRGEGVDRIRLQALQLRRNFRSLPPLVSWVNDAFARIFPRTEDIRSSAVTFLAAEAARAGDMAEKAVHIWPQAEAGATPEAQAIAAQILALRATRPEWRIAVLVQTRTVAPPVLEALRQQWIPVLGIELAPLAERQVVRDLVALGQALLHAGDRTAWLAVLHAPHCGLTLRDLHALCGADGTALLIDRLEDERHWRALGEPGQRQLQRIAPVLLRSWRERGHADLASVVERLWRELGGWQACRDEAERGAALQYLAALRRMIEHEGAPVEGATLQQLAETLRDRGRGSGENPVEVLTIHRAKGLEWDVVFVPGLGRMARADQPPLLRWLELPAAGGDTDLLLAVRSIGAAGSADPLARFIAGLHRQRQDNERVRLAYVAVTRARHRLYLSGHAPWNRAQQRPVPRQRSLLQILWPAVSGEFAAVPAPPESAAATAERLQLDTPWYHLPPDFQHPVLRAPLHVDSLGGGAVPSSTPEYDWVGPLARATGTLVHAELERFAQQGVPAPDDLPLRLPFYVSRLRESGMGAAAAAQAATRVVARLQQLVRQPRVHWLLAASHRDARSEWRLSGVVDGALRNVVIDRSFIDEHGTRWVIDFKTSSHSGGGLEQFLQSEMERYRPQLLLYRRLASRTGPEPVRAALYFPWLDEFRELDAAPASDGPA